MVPLGLIEPPFPAEATMLLGAGVGVAIGVGVAVGTGVGDSVGLVLVSG